MTTYLKTQGIQVSEFLDQARNFGYSVIETGRWGWLAKKSNSWIFADMAHWKTDEISSFHVFSFHYKELDGTRIYTDEEINRFMNLHRTV